MQREARLTTLDNPYSPFTQYQQWEDYDRSVGYNTMNLLSRFVVSSPDLSVEQQWADVEDAIDRVCFLNPTGNYKKVYESL